MQCFFNQKINILYIYQKSTKDTQTYLQMLLNLPQNRMFLLPRLQNINMTILVLSNQGA